MKTRIYYWIKGAPENRPGGPWWYEEFDDCLWAHKSMKKLIDILTPICEQLWKLEGKNLPIHNSMKIAPPKEATRIL